MNKNAIPNSLQPLIPLVKKWGIEDDGERDELVERATQEELSSLVEAINDDVASQLNEWFCDPAMLEAPTPEYIKFSVFFMAFEYAQAVLEEE